MAVSILVCGCGLKVRAAGATPGRLGRCPRCGGELRVPDDVPPPGGSPFAERRATMGELRSPDFVPPPESVRTTTAGSADSDSGGDAYGLKPSREHAARKKNGRRRPSDITPPRTGFIEKKSELHTTGGILPPLKQTESSWFGSILYPLRSADSLAVIASLTAILWLFTVLVPEYCLGLMGDADQMGAPTLGKLLGLITILPVGFLLPSAFILYWLQYLGRVLVSSAMGETAPPRTPDRNFEGFLSGLSPWFTWLLLGVGVGLLPAALCKTLVDINSPTGILLTAGVACLALPYILVALLMTFIHDDALAAKPFAVLTALFQLGGSFLFLCVFALFLVAAAAGLFVLALLLRASFFKTYLLLCIPCWAAFVWTTIVVMRLLGNHYHPQRKALGWNFDRPRWGVTWKI